MDFDDTTLNETQVAAFRGVSLDTQRRHRRLGIGPKPLPKSPGVKGERYRLGDVRAGREGKLADNAAA